MARKVLSDPVARAFWVFGVPIKSFGISSGLQVLFSLKNVCIYLLFK